MSTDRTRVEKNAHERDSAIHRAAQPAADPGTPQDRSWDSHNAGSGGEGLSNGYGGSGGKGTGPSGPESKPGTQARTAEPDETGVSLSIDRDYLARLIVKVRGLDAREGVTDPASGSNPTDDGMRDVLQDDARDLSRSEVLREIAGLNERQQAELVALLWTGRGDAEPEEWTATVELARQRRETPTPHYLLDDPLLAEFWCEGAARLGIEIPLG